MKLVFEAECGAGNGVTYDAKHRQNPDAIARKIFRKWEQNVKTSKPTPNQGKIFLPDAFSQNQLNTVNSGES